MLKHLLTIQSLFSYEPHWPSLRQNSASASTRARSPFHFAWVCVEFGWCGGARNSRTIGEWLNHSLEKKVKLPGSRDISWVILLPGGQFGQLYWRSVSLDLRSFFSFSGDHRIGIWISDRNLTAISGISGIWNDMNTIQQVGRASYQLGPENCKDSLHAKILRKRVPKNCNKFGLQSALKLQHFSLFMSGAWSLWRWPFVANPNFSSLNIDISWPKFLALTPNPWQTSASKSTKRRIWGTSSPKSWRVVCFWVYFAVEMILIVWITLCKFSPCLGLCSSSSSSAMLLTIIQQWIEMIFHPRFTAFSDAPWNFYAFSYFSFDLTWHE